MLVIEKLSATTIAIFTSLVLELWTDCDFEEEKEQYSQLIDSEIDVCLLAKANDEYVGFIHATIRHDYVEGADNLPIAYIEGLYVKPTYQKRGIAKTLVATVENWAKDLGMTQIASDTEQSNVESIAFHTQIGFSEVNRIVCFVKDLAVK